MWERFRFTQLARRAILIARVEASERGTNEIDTEHLLLALLCDGDTFAARMLEERLATSRFAISRELWKQAKRGDGAAGQEIRVAPQGARAIELAAEESQSRGSDCIDVYSLLLGLAREDEGVAGRVLRGMGADVERLRAEVRAMAGKRSRSCSTSRIDFCKTQSETLACRSVHSRRPQWPGARKRSWMPSPRSSL